MVSGVLFLLGLVPGLPLIPFWTFSILLFIVTRIIGDNEEVSVRAGATGGKAVAGGNNKAIVSRRAKLVLKILIVQKKYKNYFLLMF